MTPAANAILFLMTYLRIENRQLKKRHKPPKGKARAQSFGEQLARPPRACGQSVEPMR